MTYVYMEGVQSSDLTRYGADHCDGTVGGQL